jgi:tetratricopeptide (TPR) repeat protein
MKSEKFTFHGPPPSVILLVVGRPSKSYLSKPLEGMSFRWGNLKKRIPQSSAMSSVRPRVKGAPPWTVGDKIKGKFEVLQILGGPGRSGMGIVYIVVDRESNAIFAAKTLQDWCFRDQKSVARFEREAKLWTDLEKHANIVRAFFVERIEGRPYIFLEYVPGQDLSMRLKQEKQDVKLCIVHAIQICRAMIHAKSKIPGFLHRDIKPGNCLITPEGTLKMTDFGLSKTVLTVDEVMRVYDNEKDSDYPDITREGRRAGTLPYMAPEQFTSVHPINERSDIYSFGVTFFRMCTGKMPFEGKSAKDWMFHHIFTKPHDPCSYSDRIPPDLRAIILKCLSKRQDERFETFEEIETMLEHVLWKCFGERVTMVDAGQMEVWELCNKGLSYDRLGRSREALEFYNRALAIAPADATALCNKGVALDNLGRATEALECYRAALRLNPDLAEAWTNMGILLDSMGDAQEALQCYDRAIDVNPRYIDAWMNRGATVAAMGRLSEALDCFDTALEISPEFAGGWLTRGAALLELGLPAEALSSFNRSLSLDENFVEAWNGKGTALALLERYEKALRCFQRSLELAPSNVDALRGLGNVFLNLNRLEDALDCFQEVLAINPDDLEALGGEGAVLAAMGREREALERFDQILRLCPMDAETWKLKASTLVGMKKPEDALYAAERAVQILPGDPEAWKKKAMILASLGQMEHALKACDKAIACSPGDCEAWVIKGGLYNALGDIKEATRCYDRAININPNQPRFWVSKGLFLRKTGRLADAEECFKIAQDLDPEVTIEEE